MSSMPTFVRAFLTRRREPLSIGSFGMLIVLTVAVVVAGAVLVASQFQSL